MANRAPERGLLPLPDAAVLLALLPLLLALLAPLVPARLLLPEALSAPFARLVAAEPIPPLLMATTLVAALLMAAEVMAALALSPLSPSPLVLLPGLPGAPDLPVVLLTPLPVRLLLSAASALSPAVALHPGHRLLDRLSHAAAVRLSALLATTPPALGTAAHPLPPLVAARPYLPVPPTAHPLSPFLIAAHALPLVVIAVMVILRAALPILEVRSVTP